MKDAAALPSDAEAKRERPAPQSEARRKAFSVRPMTLDELDKALIHVNRRPLQLVRDLPLT